MNLMKTIEKHLALSAAAAVGAVSYYQKSKGQSTIAGQAANALGMTSLATSLGYLPPATAPAAAAAVTTGVT